jgi:hypothetical protein
MRNTLDRRKGSRVLAAEVVTLGRERAAIVMRDKQREFAAAVGRLYGGAANRGMLYSSGFQGQIGGAIHLEYDQRALALWEVFQPLLQAEPLSSDLGAELKVLLTQLLDACTDDLSAQHERAADLMGSATSVGDIAQFRDEALARFNSEIDVFLLTAQRAAAAQTAHRADVIQLKPGIWGLSIDLKALWRRVFRRSG